MHDVDPERYRAHPHDPDELATALAGPPLLFELYGLDSIAWDELSHAYGPAADVRLDLERLASSDPQVREGALWELYGSIYHQGDIYSATAAAIPFLFRLVAVESLPNRQEILKLLADIGESSMIGANLTHENWVQRRELGGEIYDRPTEEMEREEIENRLAVRKVLQDSEDEIREFMSDTDPAIREIAESLYATITGPEVTRYIELPDIDSPPEPIPCPHCGKMLNTGAAKQCFQCGADWH